MAEAYLNRLGEGKYRAESAGLEPGNMNPLIVRALAEDGIDISGKTTRNVFSLYKAGKTYDKVITVCSKEAAERCPIFPGKVERYHWPFDDPSKFTGSEEEVMAKIRVVRDQIKKAVMEFIDRDN